MTQVNSSISSEPIAIIGIGCRFPGGVHDAESFWQFLRDGVDAIHEIPASRFDLQTFYDLRPATPGKVMTRWGGFLDKIEEMDAYFFGISPREAERIDPQQRLLLEVAWEAFETAGQTSQHLMGRQAGVFVGQWLSDYESRLYTDPSQVDFYMTTGSGRYTSSGRLSYLFGLQGPSLTVDTACSSSLVAVHLACQSLRNGESEIALAAAVNVILQPHITIAYSQSKMMAPDGRCKFGDARANGYVRSEGAAAIVLKRLSDALADNDPIHALILGSAVNNDGQSSGFLTTPGGAGQEEVLRLAFQNAGISPGIVQYVEAHGTGTSAGDPVEIGALGAVLAEGRSPHHPCRIGSVKTNFGHTESAAGLAGLIKVVLSLEQHKLPPSLHFQTPNPDIPWDRLPLQVQNRLEDWPEHVGPAIAGVSAFGIAGTNAHVVLQEAPIPIAVSQLKVTKAQNWAGFLPLSARTPEALTAMAGRMRDFLGHTTADLQDILYTAGVRRAHHEHRLAVIGNDKAHLAESLAAFLANEMPSAVVAGQAVEQRKVVFVFPGQGSQWLGMGRQLLETQPVFREAIQRCEQVFRPFVDWSLTEQLQADEEHTRLNEIDVIQPILFAVEVALAELWISLGVRPDAVVGHSMGEVAAAYIAGAISLAEAALVICTRSRLMKRVSGKGAMAAVELTFDQAQAALAGHEGTLSIAVSNGPRSTVLSGDPTALEAVTTMLQNRGVYVRPVKVDVAAHSPHMDPLRPELEEAIAGLQPQVPAIPIYSTVTGGLVDFPLDAPYWGRNLRQPVLFSTAVDQLTGTGHSVFIECSPHPILLATIGKGSPVESSLASRLTIPSMRRAENEQATLQVELARLYCAGYAPDWSRLTPVGHCIPLPAYPWQRERFWAKEAELDAQRGPRPSARLLGARIEFAQPEGVHLWQSTLSLAAFPYLADHQLSGATPLPAAAFAEMALEAAADIFENFPFAVDSLRIQEALVLKPDLTTTVQLMFIADTGEFQILSRKQGEASWILQATGALHSLKDHAAPPPEPTTAMGRLALNDQPDPGHIAAMRARGLEYGPSFQAVMALNRGEGELFAQVRLPSALSNGDHLIHPSLLDAAFQLLIATLPAEIAPGEAYLPVGLEHLRYLARPPAGMPLGVRVVRIVTATDDRLRGDLVLFGEDGQVFLQAEGLEMQRFGAARSIDDWLYEIQWQPAESLPQPAAGSADGHWLIWSEESFGNALDAALADYGAVCTVVPEGQDFHPYLGQPVRGVIYAPAVLEPLAVEQLSASLLALVQALANANWPQPPHLWLITHEAQAASVGDSISPAQTALWGLAATIAHEVPELACTRIDRVAHTLPATIAAEILVGKDDLVALRNASVNSQRFTASLAHLEPVNPAEPPAEEVAPANGRPFRVETSQPGVLDSLELRAAPRLSPGPGQVEIEVHAAGLNFIDVMKALGVYPGMDANTLPALGLECSGVVTALGEDVAGFSIGQEVLAFAPHSFSTHVIANVHLTMPKPPVLTFDEAATLPVVYLTAYYSLCHLGQMGRNERVLIHSAAGGVGLAAIQLAQHFGAEIFATAGSDEKRAYLHSLGVPHVMDSRSLDFAEQVMAQTNGQGVDLVLNSLAGATIPKSLAVLAPYGRFLEIGKRDIYQNTRLGLAPFQKSLSYFAIDLDRLARERPEFLGKIFDQVMELLNDGSIKPLPRTTFPVDRSADAFRFMAQARHIGKIVISLVDQNVQILPSRQDTTRQETIQIMPDATYLITGGLGGLGLAVASWLTQQGARHLMLVGRSGAGNLSPEGQQTLAELQAAGVELKIAAADISQADQITAILRQLAESMPPLRGVIHAAGVLDDGVLLQQTPQRIHTVMAPKAIGAWHLHRLTDGEALDFFVMFSSITAPFGSPGQGNYAAANAFLDGLAHHRRGLGLPALSINWGPWGQIGLAAHRQQGGMQGLQGLSAIRTAVGLEIFGRLLEINPPQALASGLDVNSWIQAHPAARRSSLFTTLLAEAQSASRTQTQPSTELRLRASLLAAEPGRPRRALLENFLQEQAGQVLRLPPTRVDIHKPLRTLGMDSLMTIEFRNRLETSLGLMLSATLVWNYPTVAELAPFLAEKAGILLDAAEPAIPDLALAPDTIASEAVSSELEQLTDEDVSAQLADELDAIDELLKDS